MRVTVGFLLGASLLVAGSSAQAAVGSPGAITVSPHAPALTRVEFFCSPGFEPSQGGTCVAVPARAEVELFVDQPIYGQEEQVVHHVRRHRRHGLRERY
jgi:hypothetical protein